MCMKSELEELRGHKVAAVMSHKIDLLILSSSPCLLFITKYDNIVKKLWSLHGFVYLGLCKEYKTDSASVP